MTTINLLILRQVMIADEVVGPHWPPHKGRVALDKSDGPVKDKLSLAMPVASRCWPEKV